MGCKNRQMIQLVHIFAAPLFILFEYHCGEGTGYKIPPMVAPAYRKKPNEKGTLWGYNGDS